MSGPDRGREFAVEGAEATIGREASSDLRISDPFVSRHHCKLIVNGDQWTIRDEGTQNGTFVNGIPTSEKRLEHGDIIDIGRTTLLFVDTAKCNADVADLSAAVAKANAAASTVEFARLGSPAAAASLGRMARNLNALSKISASVGLADDLLTLERTLLQSVFEVVPADRGAILIVDAWSGEVHCDLAVDRRRGVVESIAPIDASRTKHALDSKAPKLYASREKNEYALYAPLIAADRRLGVLYLESTSELTSDHTDFVSAVSGVSAVALQNLLTIKRLQNDNSVLREELTLQHRLVGESAAIRQLLAFVNKAARVPSTVLLRGESGTGKEVVARAIHQNSPRSSKPFVAINCATLSETLLESELFGHERGAFTGADREKKGKFEVANGGTVFLDEIGEMPPTLQAKLLRVLQEREFERVGGTKPIKVDIRLIAATNADLEACIREGHFREDLFFRINVLNVTIPPLRERREDIPVLAAHFAAKFSRDIRVVLGVDPRAQALMMNYEWPGNIRELQNVIERAVVLGVSDMIMVEDLPECILECDRPRDTESGAYHEAVNDFKRRLILEALRGTHSNITEAARVLEVHPNYLHRLIRNLGVQRPRKAG